MKAKLLDILLFLYLSVCAANAQKVYHPEKSIDEAKRYFADKIMELDQVEGLYKAHLDVQISNPFTGGSNFTQDYYFIIFDPKKSENYNWPFVMVNLLDGEMHPYADVRKNGGIYSFQEKDYANNSVTIKFQMVSPMYISYSRTEGPRKGGYSKSTRTTTATKIFPTSEMYQAATFKEQSKNTASSGTGFLLSSNGFIITNNHVIDDAQNGNIVVTGINENYHKYYKARVEITDMQNDLAILKITDPTFSSISKIPYTFKFSTSSVGEECFVLGYPLISTMGKEIKLTTGIISSKTGFNGSFAQYQISAPVQPGNSGGPLFDKNGNVVGIVQAKHTQAENAGYAIKASYIRNLVEMLPTTITLPQTNLLSGKPLTQQVEQASNYVCLIIVNGSGNNIGSSVSYNKSASPAGARICPSIETPSGTLSVTSVEVKYNETVLSLSSTNNLKDGWMNISEEAYIVAKGKKYKWNNKEGIALAPFRTLFSYQGQTKSFKLYFPPIPNDTETIDFIESPSSSWKIYGIRIK